MGDRVLGQVPPLSRETVRRVLPAAVALLLLVVLDLAGAPAPWRWAAALGVWLGVARIVGRDVPVLALVALLLPLWVDHPRALESDGFHYYAYLRSLLFDGDLQMQNDYDLLGFDYHSPNVLPVGAPILWAPLVLPLRVLVRGTGTEPVYAAAACLATILYGSAGLVLLLQFLRRFHGGAAAFWTVLLLWLATPVRFYLGVLPSLAHGCEFFAAVLALRAWWSLREKPDVRRAALAGAACGLLFLVRSQDGLLLLIPGLEIALRRRASIDFVKRGAALVGGFVAAALPQVIVWQLMFGVPFLIPHKALHGEHFLHQQEPQFFGALFSERGGVFVTHPVLLVAFLALLARLRKDARSVLFILPVCVAMWVVNASVFDWYQVRRYTGLVPLLALGLVLVTSRLARAGTLAMAVLTLVAWRYDLAVDGLRANPGDPVPLRRVAQRMGDDAAVSVYAAVSRWAPRTAVRLLGTYTGEPLLLDGGVGYVELAQDSALLRMPEPARHLSEVTVEDGRAARWVTAQECRFFLPLATDRPLLLTVHARLLETVEPQFMNASWNEVPVGRLAARNGWAEYTFDVPASAVRPGTNVVVLSFDRAPLLRRIRNEGPRGVRPAALQALELHTR